MQVQPGARYSHNVQLPERLRNLASTGHPRATELLSQADALELAADTTDDPDDLTAVAAWDRAETLYRECSENQGDELDAAVAAHEAKVVKLSTGHAPDNRSIAEYLRTVADEIEAGKEPWGQVQNLVLIGERRDGRLYREVTGSPIDNARVTGLCFTAATLGVFKDPG